MNITESLLFWYEQNKRPLPWRETRDPYKIWLSEVILQQTRVNQGMDYYYRFLSAFPDVQHFAAATEQDILKLWQGLGYYSRARNMHFTAREIVEKHKGIFPDSAGELKKLKGIGDYTAAAIASICFNEPVAVLDGNVARVVSRLYAIDTPVDTPAGRTILLNLSSGLMETKSPGAFNQAVMELGALICSPTSPDCSTCPVAYACEALKQGLTDRLPVKTPKKAPHDRYLNYLVISFIENDKEFFILRKRTGNDIWKNMYDFPCIETEKDTDTIELLTICEKNHLFGGQPYIVVHVSDQYIHQLSHRRLLAKFIRITVQKAPPMAGNNLAVLKNKISEFPLPRLIDKYWVSLK